MPWNGSGTFTRTYGSAGWATDAAGGVKILSTRHDTNDTDLATGINAALAKNGENQPTAALPMAGFRHTNVGAGQARTEYARLAEIQDGTPCYLTGVAGTDTITATAPLSMAAYVTGQRFCFIAAATNTTSVTLNINGLGAKSVTKSGTTALSAGEIVSSQMVNVVYDGTRFQITDPAFDLFRSTLFYANNTAGATSITNSGAYQRVTLGTELIDVGNSFASSFYSVPSTGLYLFYGRVTLTVTPVVYSTFTTGIETADSGGATISVVAAATEIMQAVAGSAQYCAFGSFALSLTAGQRIYLNAAQNSSNNGTATAALSALYGQRIG